MILIADRRLFASLLKAAIRRQQKGRKKWGRLKRTADELKVDRTELWRLIKCKRGAMSLPVARAMLTLIFGTSEIVGDAEAWGGHGSSARHDTAAKLARCLRPAHSLKAVRDWRAAIATEVSQIFRPRTLWSIQHDGPRRSKSRDAIQVRHAIELHALVKYAGRLAEPLGWFRKAADGHEKERLELAFLRVVAPLVASSKGGFVERHWLELSQRELNSFIEFGLRREALLLDRSNEDVRAHEVRAWRVEEFGDSALLEESRHLAQGERLSRWRARGGAAKLES
jgi:hypothetical protein